MTQSILHHCDVIDNHQMFRALDTIVFGPVYWARKNIVEPLKGEEYPWYHRRFNRVPGVEDCYTDDVVCRYIDWSEFGIYQSSYISFSERRQITSSNVIGWSRRQFFICCERGCMTASSTRREQVSLIFRFLPNLLSTSLMVQPTSANLFMMRMRRQPRIITSNTAKSADTTAEPRMHCPSRNIA